MEKQISEIMSDFMKNIEAVEDDKILEIEKDDFIARQDRHASLKICECGKEYESITVEFEFKNIKTKVDICYLFYSTKCEHCNNTKEIQINERATDVLFMHNLEFCKERRIEPEYHRANINTYIPKTESQSKALEATKELIANKKGKVILTGTNGTGKTHLGISVLKELGGKIYTMYEISTIIRASYKSNAEKTELEIVDDLAWEKCLVIDEIGRTKGSETEKNWLSYLIDKRHVRGLPTFIISNNHRIEKCPNNGCERCLENYFDNDILSRFTENTKVIDMVGDDYRRCGKN